MRLVGICKDCRKRLGVDDRLTMPLNYIQVSSLPEYNHKAMAGIQFSGASQAFGLSRGGHGTTKITYKIAKTVKEAIESHSSHPELNTKSKSERNSKS